jgi:hypothetical protein
VADHDLPLFDLHEEVCRLAAIDLHEQRVVVEWQEFENGSWQPWLVLR